MKKVKFVVVIMTLVAACMFSSCNKQPVSGGRQPIGFVVNSASTKSAPITTESLKAAPYGSFLSSSFTTRSGEAYYAGAVASYADPYWPVNGQYWPEDMSHLDFWSFAPTSEFSGIPVTYSGNHKSVTFSYAPYSQPEDRSDATNQKDLIVAFTENCQAESLTDRVVPVTFNHALAAVRFKVGTIDTAFEHADKVQILGVSLEGIKGQGTCEASYAGGEDIDFTWTSSDPTSYIQLYSQTEPVTYASEGMYLDSFSTDKTVMGEDVFMLIPQTLTDASVTINWAMNGIQYSSRTKLVKNGLKLDAGVVYTFTIDLSKKENEKDIVVVLTDILPWTGVSTVVDFSHQISSTQALEFVPESCVIDDARKIVTFKDTETPIRVRFKITSPLGSNYLVRMKKDFDAFTWEPVGTTVIYAPDDPAVYSEFIIRPAVANPERNYFTNIQISVRAADGRVINCDSILQGDDPSQYYTIVLQKAI